ncbi:MAG: RNA polymerase sigma-54 factor, partial [Deltaproteobacteria bacterium]
MALDLRLQQKMSQQLVMTPQLQQAIKLLQLSHLEMADVLRDELAQNPILEEHDDSTQETDLEAAQQALHDAPMDESPTEASEKSEAGGEAELELTEAGG